MKTEDFNIKFKKGVLGKTHKLSWNNNPVRIICWDREGMNAPNGTPLPIIALVNINGFECSLLVSNDGNVYTERGTKEDFNLQVTYDPIGISKKGRVAYSLLKHPYLEKYMRKYGYKEIEEKGWHWNAVSFVNDYVNKYLNELHADLKADGRWEYDDDYDW